MVAPEIVEAILNFRKAVKPMAHNEENPHDGYAYVSIDKYYAEIARVANDVGLVWRTKEGEFDFLPGQGRNHDRTWIKCVFNYDLMVGQAIAEDYMKVTIISPIQGPQTTGQLYSYADKVFMRVLGCCVTGEKDADANPTKPARDSDLNLDTAEKTAPAQPSNVVPLHDKDTGEILEGPLSPEERELVVREKDGMPLIDTRKITDENKAKAVGMVETIFKVFIGSVKTKAKLRDWHAENLPVIEKIKKLDPAAGDRIKALFTSHNQALIK